MPTLIERIREVSSQIISLADSQVTEGEARGFATRVHELTEAANAISVPARRIELLAAKGVRIEAPSAEANALKRTIDELAVRYEADPRSILAPDANWRLATRNQLTRLADRVTPSLLAAWRYYVLSIKPVVDQGLLRVLRSSPTHAVQAKRVEELNIEFHGLLERLPVSQEEIDRPERLAKELSRILEDLPTDIPQPVRELFLAINQGTATAAHLTDEAVAWLREREMLQTLRISWRAE